MSFLSTTAKKDVVLGTDAIRNVLVNARLNILGMQTFEKGC